MSKNEKKTKEKKQQQKLNKDIDNYKRRETAYSRDQYYFDI